MPSAEPFDRKRYAHEHYVRNREKYLARAKAQRLSDPEKHRKSAVAATRKWRARKGQEALRYENAKYRYGITPEQYAALERKQGGCCAICTRKKKLHVDHDHRTGQVRGLLCGACNRGIGLLQESAAVLEAAAAYVGGR